MSRDKQFVTIWLPHRPTALRLCRQLLGEESLAEDALQEVYLKLWRKRAELDAVSDAKGYLLSTCRNHCLSLLRHREQTTYSLCEEIDLPQPDEADLVERRAEREAQLECIEQWAKALGEPLATLWRRLQIEGASSATVAEELGMSDVNVRVRLSRLRKSLRDYLVAQRTVNKV